MKNIFAVFAAENPGTIGAAIRAAFQDDALEVDTGQWLVSAEGTTQNVCERIGIVRRTDEGTLTKGTLGGALVVAVSGYYGVKPSNIWEWIKAHWETP